jgi:hypothetical protein
VALSKCLAVMALMQVGSFTFQAEQELPTVVTLSCLWAMATPSGADTRVFWRVHQLLALEEI